MMTRLSVYRIYFLLYLFGSIVISNSSSEVNGAMIDSKVLNVGEELSKETLPLKIGSRLYELLGLKISTWYEVKISYPASIPSAFSIHLKRGEPDIGLLRRKLLNTEKLIFKADENDLVSHQGGVSVLVSVERAGVVAIPNASDSELVIFNIVCDELLVGIPHKAWWIVGLAILCLGLAFVAPCFLPQHLLNKYQNFSKTS